MKPWEALVVIVDLIHDSRGAGVTIDFAAERLGWCAETTAYYLGTLAAANYLRRSLGAKGCGSGPRKHVFLLGPRWHYVAERTFAVEAPRR